MDRPKATANEKKKRNLKRKTWAISNFADPGRQNSPSPYVFTKNKRFGSKNYPFIYKKF